MRGGAHECRGSPPLLGSEIPVSSGARGNARSAPRRARERWRHRAGGERAPPRPSYSRRNSGSGFRFSNCSTEMNDRLVATATNLGKDLANLRFDRFEIRPPAIEQACACLVEFWGPVDDNANHAGVVLAHLDLGTTAPRSRRFPPLVRPDGWGLHCRPLARQRCHWPRGRW